MQPLQQKIRPDLLDQAILREDIFVLTVNPVIADLTRKNPTGKCMKFLIVIIWTHILKIMESTELFHKFRVERLEHDTAVDLRGDQVGKPGCTAPGSTSYKNAPVQVSVGIDVETTAE